MDAHLYYTSGTHVFSQPDWEDGDCDESKIKDEMRPDLTAFKWERPSWVHPALTETGHALLFSRSLIGEFSTFDVVIGHYPFVRFASILRNDGMITKPYIVCEAGMIRQLDNPSHPEHDALRGYQDAAIPRETQPRAKRSA